MQDTRENSLITVYHLIFFCYITSHSVWLLSSQRGVGGVRVVYNQDQSVRMGILLLSIVLGKTKLKVKGSRLASRVH